MPEEYSTFERSPSLRFFQKDGYTLGTVDETTFYHVPDLVLTIIALCDGSNSTHDIAHHITKNSPVEPHQTIEQLEDVFEFLKKIRFVKHVRPEKHPWLGEKKGAAKGRAAKAKTSKAKAAGSKAKARKKSR